MIKMSICCFKLKGLPRHRQVKEIAENDPHNPDGGRSVNQPFPEGFVGEFTPLPRKEVGEVEETSHFYYTENHPQHIHTAAEKGEGNCQKSDKIQQNRLVGKIFGEIIKHD